MELTGSTILLLLEAAGRRAYSWGAQGSSGVISEVVLLIERRERREEERIRRSELIFQELRTGLVRSRRRLLRHMLAPEEISGAEVDRRALELRALDHQRLSSLKILVGRLDRLGESVSIPAVVDVFFLIRTERLDRRAIVLHLALIRRNGHLGVALGRDPHSVHLAVRFRRSPTLLRDGSYKSGKIHVGVRRFGAAQVDLQAKAVNGYLRLLLGLEGLSSRCQTGGEPIHLQRIAHRGLS